LRRATASASADTSLASIRREALAQQLADERARHDHPLVHIERIAPDERLVGEVRGRFAGGNPPFNAVPHGPPLAHGQPGVEPGIELIDGEVERVQDQEGGLIEGVGCPMAVGQLRRVEPADCIAQPIPEGDELLLQILRVLHGGIMDAKASAVLQVCGDTVNRTSAD
jgi:hypothetical protein